MGNGLRLTLYLDDGIVAVKGEERAKCESERIQGDLAKAGLIVNYSKSHWLPTKRLLWLGFKLDLEKGQLRVPQKSSRSLTATALASTYNWKNIAHVIGPIKPVACLMTWACMQC